MRLFSPANTKHVFIADLMLVHRLRRWPEIESTLYERSCFNWELAFTVAERLTYTTHLPNVWLMLAHRLRRWPNIGQTLDRCVVFAGTPLPERRCETGHFNIRDLSRIIRVSQRFQEELIRGQWTARSPLILKEAHYGLSQSYNAGPMATDIGLTSKHHLINVSQLLGYTSSFIAFYLFAVPCMTNKIKRHIYVKI